MKIKILTLTITLLVCIGLRAQTADELVTQGRSSLASNDLSGANAKFIAALAVSPNHPTANVLAGATRLLVFVQQPATQSFLDRLNISAEGRDIFLWTADFTRDTNGTIMLPSDFDSVEVVNFIQTQLLPAVGASQTNFSKVTGTTFTLSLSAEETGINSVTIDYGDIQLMRALLYVFDFFGKTITTHNLSVQLNVIADLDDGGLFNIQNLLLVYPDLLTIADAPRLAAAKVSVQNAIARYNAASTFIRARPTAVERLFNLSLEDREEEADFRQKLAKISQSLNGAVRLSPDDPRSYFFGSYFSGAKSLRALLPAFEGDHPVSGTFPDPTLAGTIPQGSSLDLEEAVGGITEFVERNEAGRPTVSITAPLANARLISAPILIQGTANDFSGIASVEFQLNGSAFQTADGTTSWSATVNPVPGTNTVRVRSFDIYGNESALASRKFVYALYSPLNLQIVGSGSITGATNGQSFEVGKSVKLKAVPAGAFLFEGWSSDTVSTNATLTFIMQLNHTLTATFVTNIFIPAKGIYNGLFTGEGSASPTNSGFVKLTLTDKGAFSGNLKLAGATLPFRGQFNPSGVTQVTVTRRNQSSLILDLTFNGNRISGPVSSGGNLLAQLRADLAGKFLTIAPALQAGNYTWLIPGDSDVPALPAGFSAATAAARPTGATTLKGTLADGTIFNQAVPLSASGEVPAFVSLYGGKGILFGWLTFTNTPGAELQGSLQWIKTPVVSKYYSNGFALEKPIVGASYHAPGGTTNVLTWASGIVETSGGNLLGTNVNSIQVTNNRVTVTGNNSNKLTLTIQKASGLFSGSFVHPATGKPAIFKGALLQPLNRGGGFFFGTNQCGSVSLSPTP